MDTQIITKAEVARAASPEVPGRVWRLTAWVSGVFVVVLAAVLLWAHQQSPVHDPLNSTAMVTAREQLHAAPKDEAVKQRIRELDVQIRHHFFLSLARNEFGGWLLLGGLTLFVVAARQVMLARLTPPEPAAPANAAERFLQRRSQALMGVGVVGAVTLAGVAFLGLLKPAPQVSLAAKVEPPAPSAAEYLANWPRFRGPLGDGSTLHTNVPVSFDATTGENVLWKSEVPLSGFNSPVVWGNRVFLTGSDGLARELFCFDASNGALLWRLAVTNVSAAAIEALKVPKETGLVAATVATDGERVYAIFATGELIAADFSGRLLWSKTLGKLENLYGHASSLLTWQRLVIVQLDQGDAESKKSRMIAYDGRNGSVAWEQRREVAASWATPLIGRFGDRELLITVSDPWTMASEPASGKEVWRFGGFGADLAPSPILAGANLVTVDAGRQLIAIRSDGQGDVSKTHGIWTNMDFVPDITSPVSDGELLFTLPGGGTLACFELKTGKQLWDHSFEKDCQASPALVGKRLYLFTTEGEGIIANAAREFAEIGRGKLGERVHASPAFVQDRMIVRTEKHLVCIGAKPGKEAASAR